MFDYFFLNYRDSFQNLLDNIERYRSIAVSHRRKILVADYELIMSDNLIEDVQTELELQDPVCNMINILQKKETNIADGADLWLGLEIPQHVTNDERKSYLLRKDMALGEVALAAFFIDPFKIRTKLSRSQREDARHFITTRLRGHLTEFEDYEKESSSKTQLLATVQNGIDFWTLAEDYWPNLAKIALKLLRIPASTSQLERVFSMWQHIHSRLRNRLTFDRSKKLMHIYYYFHQLDPKMLDSLNI